ncbi:hypothetical protein RB195_024224 [Necator americanus]|uniref:Uncharacterized protein n=1 Tax=Necator americanus TaxID=51031 RepID=A0ABR1EMB3_NECAM
MELHDLHVMKSARKTLQRRKKKDLKERTAALLAEAAEASKSIRYACRNFASRKTKVNTLRNPNVTKHKEGEWRKSLITCTQISSAATSTFLLTI